MALTFLATPPFVDLWTANPVALRAFIEGVVRGPSTVAWVAEQAGDVLGMIGAALFIHPFSGELVAQEIGWFMKPAARRGRVALSLLAEAERWARAAGAQVFQVQAPTLRVGRFYEARGYQPFEYSYQRRLSAWGV